MIPIRPYGAGQVHPVLKWANVYYLALQNRFIFHILQTISSFFFTEFIKKTTVITIILCFKAESASI